MPSVLSIKNDDNYNKRAYRLICKPGFVSGGDGKESIYEQQVSRADTSPEHGLSIPGPIADSSQHTGWLRYFTPY